MTSPLWDIHTGDILTREQIHGGHGGNPQAGISRASSSPDVLVYSDHEKASANGYNFDGWDSDRRVLFYTGEGRDGDQVLMRATEPSPTTPGTNAHFASSSRSGTCPAPAPAYTNMSVSSGPIPMSPTSCAAHPVATGNRGRSSFFDCCQ